MPGIVSYGAYIPYHRLRRSAIAEALGTGGRKGTRAVAGFDEDSTSMGVEAARAALHGQSTAVDALLFATSSPAYLDKTNATAVHAALDLPGRTAAYDVGASARSGAAAFRLALRGGAPTLVVTADIRTGLPGGGDEANGGDGAAAFVVGDGPDVLAELIGIGAASGEFLDRWRLPGDKFSRQWEERFGEQTYAPLAEVAVVDALKSAGLTAQDVDHVIVVGPNARAVRRVTTSLRPRPAAVPADLAPAIGNTGAAHLGLAVADVLDRAQPGQTVLAVSVADGADAFLFRTTEALALFSPRATVDALVRNGDDSLSYAAFLTWRSMLHREPQRRPEPDTPAAPPSHRGEAWKFGFTASRCASCGARHLPPQRVCVSCRALDRMQQERLADVPATITTYTVDRLAYSMNPPVVAAVVDFDGGGRFHCEVTDADPAAVRIGDRVEMTFRRLYTASHTGVHNYFWKARPLRRASDSEEG